MDIHLCWTCVNAENAICDAYEEMMQLSEKYYPNIKIHFRVTECEAYEESPE